MNQPKYQQFVFKDCQFDENTKELVLAYSMDESLEFIEKFKFDFEFVKYDYKALKRAMENLFFMAGISYYKMYLPPEIVMGKGVMDESTSAFLSKTYQRGLGEFWYVNQLDPNTQISFPVNATVFQNTQSSNDGILVAIGGGKDSLTSVELLRDKIPNLATWSLNHREQLAPLVERIGLPHLWVDRTLDPKIKELNEQDALNGHIPISAIFACVGTVVAILSGKRDIVVSNEQSANEPTLVYEGVEINHQYSKTLEFERDYQNLLLKHFGESQRYYSLLRPYGDLRVSEIFAKIAFNKYKDVFSSCNKAFRLDSRNISWCGECPKCAFTFLIFTPFIAREELEILWNGKNLLQDPEFEPIYKQLLGINSDKPFECVGEIRENRTAMIMAQQQYLDLLRYHFDMPEDYNFRTIRPSSMPADVLRLLITQI